MAHVCLAICQHVISCMVLHLQFQIWCIYRFSRMDFCESWKYYYFTRPFIFGLSMECFDQGLIYLRQGKYYIWGKKKVMGYITGSIEGRNSLCFSWFFFLLLHLDEMDLFEWTYLWRGYFMWFRFFYFIILSSCRNQIYKKQQWSKLSHCVIKVLVPYVRFIMARQVFFFISLFFFFFSWYKWG